MTLLLTIMILLFVADNVAILILIHEVLYLLDRDRAMRIIMRQQEYFIRREIDDD